MNILILQPPLTQLNTPYPSGAYLSAFFKAVQTAKTDSPPIESSLSASVESVRWIDLSCLLYHELFCASGLKKIFDKTEKKALLLAENAEKNGDEGTAFNLRRYINHKDKWITQIDAIQSILCGGSGCAQKSGREFRHEFVRSAHMPRGSRMENFLGSKESPTADDASFLATLAIEDLCDYIKTVYDENFEPVRYASSLAESTASFTAIEKASHAPVMTDFFEPLLETLLSEYTAKNENWLVCLSVPFPGTLAAAITSCRVVKRLFGERALILLGGGYVNTELRDITRRDNNNALFSYVDYLVYDRGYGALLGLLKKIAQNGFSSLKEERSGTNALKVLTEAQTAGFTQAEDFFTRSLVPDYSDIDFSRYPRLVDDTNPMFRLWSDGAWIKAYLAHGCYWARCSFCDTTLDYVKNYRMTQTKTLYEGLLTQAQQKGVYGIHFVDEAAPPRALKQFALLNCRSATRRLTFWGNIRFEKSFTRHTADLLAYGGLTGVTGGIEIAAGTGLKSVSKGIDIESLVATCAAFKEAGILVHAYMIFGYWEETPQILIDSMETLRQMFATGLLDSAFWHKFVLTKHSRLYTEWKNGDHQSLRPYEEKNTTESRFAENDLRFEGENDSQKYALPLDSALNSWKRAQKQRTAVQKWFSFPMPAPSIPSDFIEKHIISYEKKREAENAECAAHFENFKTQSEKRAQNAKRLYWLGGKPVVTQIKNGKFRIFWLYMDEEFSVVISSAENSEKITRSLYELSPKISETSHKNIEINYNEIMKNLIKSEFPVRFFSGKGLIYT